MIRPKGCTCREVVDLWCRVHYPDNRVKVRWNSICRRYEWRDQHGNWMDLYGDLTIAYLMAKSRAVRSAPNAYEAWARRQPARP